MITTRIQAAAVFCVAFCAIVFGSPAVADDSSVSSFGQPVGAGELDNARGTGAEFEVNVNATNSSTSTVTTDNSVRSNEIASSAFSNLQGVGVVTQNAGDGNIFNIVTNVTVEMN